MWKRATLYRAVASFSILSFLLLVAPATSTAGKTLTLVSNAQHSLTQVAISARVTGNFLVDQDHTLPFSQNKQNEPAITRDPLTGVLIAGANDEQEQPLCSGTTIPLASPCSFAPGVPTSASYRSTDNGQT